MNIEFNAWHPASNSMFEWKDLAIFGEDNRIEHRTEGCFTTDPADPNHLILLPFTGAFDIKQNKLFLGDIFNNGINHVYKVIFDKHSGFKGISNDGDKYGPYGMNLYHDVPPYHKNNKNIKIGNIYQNPKLFPKINY